MPRLLLTLAAVLLSCSAFAEDADIASRFAHVGCDGTLVFASRRTGETFVHHDVRAQRRFDLKDEADLPPRPALTRAVL